MVRAGRARVATVPPAAKSTVPGGAVRPTVLTVRADRGTYAGLTRTARARRAGVTAVRESGFRTAKAIGVPAVRVITQVIVRFPRIAIPKVKVISFAAHASSLVARRSRLTGMRPLPERRVQQSREPADVKRYLLRPVLR